jgi:type IV conjugative transfer system protein TraL
MSDSTKHTPKHAILHYLDEPVRFLYWTKGELGFYFGIPFMGMLLEQELLGVVLTVMSGLVHRAFKKRFGTLNLQVLRYWYFPPDRRLACLPPSHIRNYIG